MTESLPIKLSPLGPHLMKLLQKKEEPSVAKKSAGPKRRRIITVIEAIEETPPPASASKTPAAEDATATEAAPAEAATAEAATTEDTSMEGTFFDIDNMLLNMATEEDAIAAEETLATVPGKEKEIAEDTSEEKDFNFQNIIGQKLSKAEKEELRDYAISCGYQPGALLFDSIDDESLGCLRDRTGAKVISTLSKSIGFPKLEADISRYRRQHIVGSLFYSNFKVKFFSSAFHCFNNEGVF
jgi:biotin carboxyl carrier protein